MASKRIEQLKVETHQRIEQLKDDVRAKVGDDAVMEIIIGQDAALKVASRLARSTLIKDKENLYRMLEAQATGLGLQVSIASGAIPEATAALVTSLITSILTAVAEGVKESRLTESLLSADDAISKAMGVKP